MTYLRFEWDKSKERANRKKHGISFEEAKTAFHDPSALLLDDPDHSVDEDRFVLLGMSMLARVLVVCHCLRKDGDTIRIISARKATTNERRTYGGSHAR